MAITIINNFLSHCDHDSDFARHAIEPFEEQGGIDRYTIYDLSVYSTKPDIYTPILAALSQPGREDWFVWAGVEKISKKQENYHNSSNGGGNAVPISAPIKIGTAAECAADQADQ